MLVMRQIYVYLFQYKVRWTTDMRIHILFLCLLNSAYAFIHYSFEPSNLKSKTFFIFEISQFTIFYMICYYYIQKASSLLPRREAFILAIRVFFLVGISTILTVGFIIFKRISVYLSNHSDPYGIDPGLLCRNYLFWVFRIIPFVFVVIFSLAYFKIKTTISKQRAMSVYDVVAQ